MTKTHRAVIVEEDWPYCGLGAGIADRIMQVAFDELDAPIRRVAAKDAPIPYNRASKRRCCPASTASSPRSTTSSTARAAGTRRVRMASSFRVKRLHFPNNRQS